MTKKKAAPETLSVRMSLGIGLANAKQDAVIEFDRSEIMGMTKAEIEEWLHEQWKEWIWDYIDGGADIIE